MATHQQQRTDGVTGASSAHQSLSGTAPARAAGAPNQPRGEG